MLTKAPFAIFPTSKKMIADNEGKPTSRVWDVCRTKTFVKPPEMLDPKYPPFDQPHQFACQLYGGTWNDYNEVCVFQVFGPCGLRCWYCYVDRMFLQTEEIIDCRQVAEWLTPEQVRDIWRQSGTKILNLSGGEPTQFPRFMAELAMWMQGEKALLWFSTNMSSGSRLFDVWEGYFDLRFMTKPHAGIAGCFKGFSPEDALDMAGANLDEQFIFAQRLVKQRDLEVFFYVPGLVRRGTSQSVIEAFFERLRQEVDEFAPLRTYILLIKPYASTDPEIWEDYSMNINDSRRVVDVWQGLCRDHYKPEELWLPSHQIKYQCYR